MSILQVNNESIKVSPETSLNEAAEQLGVPFGCESGVCQVCQVEVLEGKELLNELTDEESDLALEENERLCCQMKIKKEGTVLIEIK